MARGELFTAYDVAQTAITDGSRSNRLVYLRSLAMARMGNPGGALASLDSVEPEQMSDEDSLSLRGRILKDLALENGEDRRGKFFDWASEAYLVAHQKSGGAFSLINAASTAFLAGRRDSAAKMALDVLALPAIQRPAEFYDAATSGEAYVLLGRFDDAERAFEQALAFPDAHLGHRASAARQLGLLSRGGDAARIEAIARLVRPPPVLFFAGHMFHHDPAIEARIEKEIEEALNETECRIAFGGAAAGSDILFAESILRRGGELNLVLPFDRDDYVRQSVRPWGENWIGRFNAVMSAAAQITYPANTQYLGDPHQFAYGSEIAMGLACLRADHLSTEAVQIAVSNETETVAPAGSGSGIQLWRGTGRKAWTIAAEGIDRSRSGPREGPRHTLERECRSIIMADYSGFSKLTEAARPLFLDEVMGRVARILDARKTSVLSCNTWGDALFAIVSEPVAAADLALAVQEELAQVDPTMMALSADAGMRIALHHGPLYRAIDPVTNQMSYFGNEVTRAARIEPITPIGQVYATQPLAALLALHASRFFHTRYAGQLNLHKNYGMMPMHMIARAAAYAQTASTRHPSSQA